MFEFKPNHHWRYFRVNYQQVHSVAAKSTLRMQIMTTSALLAELGTCYSKSSDVAALSEKKQQCCRYFKKINSKKHVLF